MATRCKVKDLRKGDILVPTGNEIVSVSYGITTPARCRDVVIKRPKGRVEHRIWKSETLITVNRTENENG